MISEKRLQKALQDAGAIACLVNANIFFGWLTRNKFMEAAEESEDFLLEKAIEFKEEYK